MSSQVILYDLPSRQGTSWSLNPWKTRMVLNYKGIDYKTEWIEYPHLASTLKSFGLPPNDPNDPGTSAEYSAPAIKYSSGSYGMDSWYIAHELEKQYPSPPLHLDDPIVVRVRDHISKLRDPLIPHILPKVPVVVLNKVSADYFNETRGKHFGMSLLELEKSKTADECWEAAKEAAKEAGDLLRKNGGPFFLGQTVSYADFILVGLIHMIKRLDEGSFRQFLALDPAFSKLYEASKEWLEKDD